MGKKDKKKKYIVGIDLGGTKMLTGLLNKDFKILNTKKVKMESHKGAKFFIQAIEDSIAEVLEDSNANISQVKCIGIGCPGMIDFKTGTVLLAPNIHFLKNFPLAEKIRKKFQVPVVVENDVNAGLYGEYQFGAAQGYSHVAGFFLGTGIGGGLILDGKLYRGVSGGAGEFGHMFLDMGREAKLGTLEAMAGRLAIASEASILSARQIAPALFKIAGTDIREIKSKALSQSIKSGDAEIEKLMLRKSRVLGFAMANIVNALNPELIVLGGGVMEAMGDLILKEAREMMQASALGPLVKHVKVVKAKLMDDAIVVGAAKLAFDDLKMKES